MKLLLATMIAAPPSARRAHSKRFVAGAMLREVRTFRWFWLQVAVGEKMMPPLDTSTVTTKQSSNVYVCEKKHPNSGCKQKSYESTICRVSL